MLDPRTLPGPTARLSLVDLVCVAALTALLFWGAYAIADITHAGAPSSATPAAPAH